MNNDELFLTIILSSGKVIPIDLRIIFNENDIKESITSIEKLIEDIYEECIESAKKQTENKLDYASSSKIIVKEMENIVNQVNNPKQILSWFMSMIIIKDLDHLF